MFERTSGRKRQKQHLFFVESKMKTILVIVTVFFFVCESGIVDAQSYYKNDQGLFSTRPNETQSLNNIKRLGPVGMGIDLIQPAFTMRISHIEENSPAATTGKLKTGQIIETINGQRLAEIDPRIQLGQIVAEAEASDGILRFKIKDQTADAVVTIPAIGAYSETWPLDCPKSDQIVRKFADYLSKPDSPIGFGGIGMLFLLSDRRRKRHPTRTEVGAKRCK